MRAARAFSQPDLRRRASVRAFLRALAFDGGDGAFGSANDVAQVENVSRRSRTRVATLAIIEDAFEVPRLTRRVDGSQKPARRKGAARGSHGVVVVHSTSGMPASLSSATNCVRPAAASHYAQQRRCGDVSVSARKRRLHPCGRQHWRRIRTHARAEKRSPFAPIEELLRESVYTSGTSHNCSGALLCGPCTEKADPLHFLRSEPAWLHRGCR
ncbi:hypothetical protein MRX96_029667 [Rhipicephalus microplus]